MQVWSYLYLASYVIHLRPQNVLLSFEFFENLNHPFPTNGLYRIVSRCKRLVKMWQLNQMGFHRSGIAPTKDCQKWEIFPLALTHPSTANKEHPLGNFYLPVLLTSIHLPVPLFSLKPNLLVVCSRPPCLSCDLIGLS